jgi:uncharacterized protein
LVHEKIKFLYGEPALIASANGNEYLVIGDLHIGMELGLSKKGVHLFGATERMSTRINSMMKEFSLEKMIILGDIKESILYPDSSETNLLRKFFKDLEGFEIKIVAGNHDAHLEAVIDRKVEKDIIIGEFGFTHGNRNPSPEMMSLDYIISGHEHIAVRIKDKSGAYYDQKAWIISKLDKREAKKSYEKFNPDLKLISIPAFNDLIMGTIMEKGKKRINPSARNLFSNREMEVYNILGQKISL